MHSGRVPSRILTATLFVVSVIFSGWIESTFANEPRKIEFLTGLKFRKDLEQPLTGNWDHIDARRLLRRLEEVRQVSIVLDRRLDPSTELEIDLVNSPLRIGLSTIARQVDGEISILENTVFVGTKPSSKYLRTLAESRSVELESRQRSITATRRSQLQKRNTFAWNDLDTPREILDAISKQWSIKINQLETIPHDLWAASVLPSVSASEVLSLVLIQFDKTFEWSKDCSSIDIVSLPKLVSLVKRHRLKSKSSIDLESFLDRFPKLDPKIEGDEIVVAATAEEHDAIENLLKGESTANTARVAGPPAIRRRKFSLQTERVPISAIMRKLEESAISFSYDETEFKKRGIDLNTLTRIDVEQATATEFFKLLFDPIGVDFEISELTVRLKPQ